MMASLPIIFKRGFKTKHMKKTAVSFIVLQQSDEVPRKLQLHGTAFLWLNGVSCYPSGSAGPLPCAGQIINHCENLPHFYFMFSLFVSSLLAARKG